MPSLALAFIQPCAKSGQKRKLKKKKKFAALSEFNSLINSAWSQTSAMALSKMPDIQYYNTFVQANHFL